MGSKENSEEIKHIALMIERFRISDEKSQEDMVSIKIALSTL